MQQPMQPKADQKQVDWAQIAANPRFKQLHRKKVRFLFGWWLISTVIYVIFLVCANLTQKLFSWRVIGDINFGYLAILGLFIYCWFIAGFYASWANKVADKITDDLIGELKRGGMQK